MGPGVFFPLPLCVSLMILKEVNNVGLCITSVAYDISDDTSSSPILLLFPVPDMMKGRPSFKKEMGDEKNRKKGKISGEQ